MEFIETALFTKLSRIYLNDDELAQLQRILISYPDMGAIITGSGGVRKLRWMSGGKGKRGGLRIIYYWVTAEHQIYLLHVYQKNRQEDLTVQEIRRLKEQVEE